MVIWKMAEKLRIFEVFLMLLRGGRNPEGNVDRHVIGTPDARGSGYASAPDSTGSPGGASVAAPAADAGAPLPSYISAGTAREAIPTGDLLVYDLPETLTLLPEDSVWVPMRRATTRVLERSRDPMDNRTPESLHEVVLSVPNRGDLESRPWDLEDE